MKFMQILKDVFVSKFWVKAICFLLALFVVLVINL
jgi:hypothetical protein